MRILLQKVKNASVEVDGEVRSIAKGIVLFVGIAPFDTITELEWCLRKILSLEIWEGNTLATYGGEVLLVSQFTLYASVRKGKKPSFSNAAKPDIAEVRYNEFVAMWKAVWSGKLQTGEFGADMQVRLQNDGPYTLLIEKEV